MEQILVNASKRYQVVIGSGLLEQAGGLAAKVVTPHRAMIVTDENVAPHYLGALSESLRAGGYAVESLVLRSGEATKSMETLGKLLAAFAAAELSRRDAVFALGGGVVGDVAGFAASVFLRGIACIQVPTTLLAAVDSSVGGKTGVHLPAGRNLAGTIWQPSLVLCDTRTLETLSPERLSDGMAEVVKYAVISDRSFFQQLSGGMHSAQRDVTVERMIARCVKVKAEYVMRDESDTGIRRVLGFGSTVGRAAELCSGYKLAHGAALSIGMTVITRAAERAGLCMPMSGELTRALAQYHLPVKCPFSAEELSGAILRGRENGDPTLCLVLPRQIGQAETVLMAPEKALSFIAAGLAE